jgi:hypothetical protein
MRLRCKLEPFSWSNPHLKIDYPVSAIVPVPARASVIGDTFWWNSSMIWTSVPARGGSSAAVTVGRSILSSNGSAWNALGGATLQSYQNNQVTGTTGTPPSPISFQ